VMNNSDNETDRKTDFTDQTLIQRLQDGEVDAATALYVRYSKRLQSLATNQTSRELSYRVGSDEIVQSVFRTFFRRANMGQYAVADGEDLWKLFLVIALNKIRKASEFHHAQKRDIKRTRSFESSFLETKSSHSGENDVAYSILRMTVDESLNNLRSGHDEVVRLRIEGYSLPEIAEKTGRAKRTVERILQNFRQSLLTALEDD